MICFQFSFQFCNPISSLWHLLSQDVFFCPCCCYPLNFWIFTTAPSVNWAWHVTGKTPYHNKVFEFFWPVPEPDRTKNKSISSLNFHFKDTDPGDIYPCNIVRKKHLQLIPWHALLRCSCWRRAPFLKHFFTIHGNFCHNRCSKSTRSSWLALGWRTFADAKIKMLCAILHISATSVLELTGTPKKVGFIFFMPLFSINLDSACSRFVNMIQ